MKTPIYILNGEPRVIVEPPVYPNDTPRRKKSDLIKAHGEGKGFDGVEDFKLLIQALKDANPLSSMVMRDGLYHVDLPEHTEVRQYRYKEISQLAPSEWFDVPPTFTSSGSVTVEFRTILRFTEGEAKKGVGWPITKGAIIVPSIESLAPLEDKQVEETQETIWRDALTELPEPTGDYLNYPKYRDRLLNNFIITRKG